MRNKKVLVDHPLLSQLYRLDKEAASLFPSPFDPGLGDLGLIIDKRLDDSRYETFTPRNVRTFAHTGGNGVHFSLSERNGKIDENSIVVITIPPAFMSFIVGENLRDFLNLGAHRGYFALEQLAYNESLTLEVFTNPHWRATEPNHFSNGYELSDHESAVMEFLRSRLDLTPWNNADRYSYLQEKYLYSLDIPDLES